MLYWLSAFSDTIGPLNVLRYITFRTGGAMITALVFVFLFGPWIIDQLRLAAGQGPADPQRRAAIAPRHQEGHAHHGRADDPVRDRRCRRCCGPIPTNRYVWIVLGVTLTFGAIGFYDDYLKVTKQTHAGFSGKLRFVIEALIAAVGVLFHRVARAPAVRDLAHLSVLQGAGPAARLVLPRVRQPSSSSAPATP